jgi:probable HAF family extracellular repeat protein
MWDPVHGMQDLGAILDDTKQSWARGVNNNGWVVGDIKHSSVRRIAYVWDPVNGRRDLGDLPGGDVESFARGINDHGVVVGWSDVGGGGHSFVWDAINGMRDLNDLIDPASGWVLYQTSAINSAGQIVGTGRNPDGNVEAFLLTPIPEPATLALVGTGLLTFLVGRRKKR